MGVIGNVNTKEFSRRRKQLLRMLEPGDIAILPAANVSMRNRDVEYRYRQDSDFYYLTGFPEPEAVAVFIPGRKHGEYVLFCREHDEVMETWNGARAGQDGACDEYGADDSFPITDINDILPGLMENTDRVFYTMGINSEFDQRVIKWVNRLKEQVRSGVHAPGEFVNLDYVLHEMRLVKSVSEQRAMRQAAKIAVAGHERTMRACQPGMFEYELEAEMLYEFTRKGSPAPAYASIVGGGKNACTLHYIDNNEVLNDGDLVLIDAGAEFDYYASDITRTFPVNGTYSKPQKALYEVVLAAQLAAIDAVKPDNHWNDPHEAAVRVMTEGLVELGLLKGRVPTLIKKEAYRRFYMHRTGHWLGMDVHDVGDYKLGDEWRVLEKGMVLTVEPGLYIPHGAKGVAKKWQGIGIRIEDDVLVTKNGHEVLTGALAKTVDDVEALMAS